jgi:hypothetical protein
LRKVAILPGNRATVPFSVSVSPFLENEGLSFKIRRDVSVVSIAFQSGGDN